jgi:hypothetical protein
LAAAGDVGAMLDGLGDADLVLMSDPLASRPVRVLLATRVAAPVEKLRRVLTDAGSYGKAMPAFRRVEVVSRSERAGAATAMEVAWELEVPLWNLKGKLWLRPRSDGVDLEIFEGDFAPGLFHLTARGERAGKLQRSLLVIEGFANLRDASMATRELVRRSPLAEPAMTVAAAYVMLKSLARLAEDGTSARPSAALVPPDPSSLDGAGTVATALARAQGRVLLAAVRSRADGRLARIEVAMAVSARAGQAAARGLRPEIFRALPGWKKTAVVGEPSCVCADPASPCWAVEGDLPIFSLDGLWKIRPRPWRARMVSGDAEGALMAIDVVSSKSSARATVVLSEHPRMDRAGYIARKLIVAEPYLEHGLALALTLVHAASLGPALEQK